MNSFILRACSAFLLQTCLFYFIQLSDWVKDVQQSKINVLDKVIDIQIKPFNSTFDYHQGSVTEVQWFPLPCTFPTWGSTTESSVNEFGLCNFSWQLPLSVPSTFGHIRDEKKRAESIDVNYADVTREGTQWSVSPPKKSIKVKQLVSPSFFFPLQSFNSVTTTTMCRITAHINTHTTKIFFIAETHAL